MNLHDWIDLAARCMEGGGVLTMVLGSLVALGLATRRLVQRERRDAFRVLRQALGRAILLGLEFLIAADIIRTVSESPTFSQVTVLAVIVLIRTFLSFTLQVELEGRWPWQPATPDR